jgi:hypothetical protein
MKERGKRVLRGVSWEKVGPAKAFVHHPFSLLQFSFPSSVFRVDFGFRAELINQ